MKKIIIAVAIVCTVAFSQAASVSWTCTRLLNSSGTTLTTGMGYLFTTKGDNATSVDTVRSALANLTSVAALKTYLDENSLTALKGVVSSGAISVTGIDLASSGVPAATSGVKVFAVIVDDADFGNATKYIITGTSANIKTPAASTSNNAVFSLDGATASSAGNWAAIPEPTSGMLILFGIAGLALKRKCA